MYLGSIAEQSAICMGVNMKDIIQVSGLTKEYSHRKVLDNLSLRVYSGDIVGLIGPNGAGKSTTMKIIMRLIRQTSGDIKIYGNNNINNTCRKWLEDTFRYRF